ncbi:MAG: FAD-dependent oxidoreductase [Deltaproteobacteria bacterium]|nr:FAD-dependent oxidoreductase [Deltaproteobacteria bacterium]
MSALPPRERRWAEALFDAILGPVERHGLPSFASIDHAGFYRAIDHAPGPPFAPGLRGMVTAATLATLPTHGRPFHALDRDARVRAIDTMSADPRYLVRQILSTLKILATFAYFEDPEVRRRVGADVDAPHPDPRDDAHEAASALVHLDGRTLDRPRSFDCDVVIVGSGPAGATVARSLARRGLDVIVLEEGHEARPSSFVASGLQSMARLYREMGTSMALGTSPMPFLQGVAVGGTSVVNGAISWRFSEETLARWIASDPSLAPVLELGRIRTHEEALFTRLGVTPTDDAIAGPKNLLLAKGAKALSIASRPIERNVEGCRGSGRCLQGCPHGAKLSVDRNLLVDAKDDGARILAGMRVDRVLHDGARAIGVAGTSAGGARFDVIAKKVVLAASAIGTPTLLMKSGITHGPVGRHLTAHPGVSVTARFGERVSNHRGATQGHEVTGLRGEGLKVEALGFDVSILASRVPGYGTELAERLASLDRFAVWGTALRAEGEGSVRLLGDRAQVLYSLAPGDVKKARAAVRRMGELFLAAGAEEVYPGVPGFHAIVRDPKSMARFEQEGPLSPRAYAMSMTHLFGTTRLGSDPARSVVGLDFQHHALRGLFVADSSVFPGNLGVNPQLPIMTLASIAAESIASAP